MARTKASVKQQVNENNFKAVRKTKANTGGIKIKFINKKPKVGAFKIFKKGSNFLRMRICGWHKISQNLNNLVNKKINFEEKYNEVLKKLSDIENEIIKLSNKLDFWRDGKNYLKKKLKILNKQILQRQLKLYKKIKNI